MRPARRYYDPGSAPRPVSNKPRSRPRRRKTPVTALDHQRVAAAEAKRARKAARRLREVRAHG